MHCQLAMHPVTKGLILQFKSCLFVFYTICWFVENKKTKLTLVSMLSGSQQLPPSTQQWQISLVQSKKLMIKMVIIYNNWCYNIFIIIWGYSIITHNRKQWGAHSRINCVNFTPVYVQTPIKIFQSPKNINLRFQTYIKTRIPCVMWIDLYRRRWRWIFRSVALGENKSPQQSLWLNLSHFPL